MKTIAYPAFSGTMLLGLSSVIQRPFNKQTAQPGGQPMINVNISGFRQEIAPEIVRSEINRQALGSSHSMLNRSIPLLKARLRSSMPTTRLNTKTSLKYFDFYS
jgi:hypothetical protein